MDLKNKIMKLYEDILEPKKERKIVLLLKYVIVDGETDLNKIREEINIGEEFIHRILNDDSLILKYLTQEEIKKFRLKMDYILGKNNKLIRLINFVLIKNETNVEEIIKRVPISAETIRAYAADKEKLLKYLTEEELQVFLNRLKPMLYKTKTIPERLIETILTDGETDLDKIEKRTFVKIATIKKYSEDPKNLEKYLTQEEINLFVSKVKKMFIEREVNESEKDKKYVKQIINDILNTRYLYADICAKNLFSIKKFEQYLYDEEYMKKEFPKVTSEMIKGKIKENEKIRIRKPYDMDLIEDRFCVMIAKNDVHYLNQFDMKKLNVASYYLGTGADLKSVMNRFELSEYETLAILSDAKLKQILDPKYYEILDKSLKIEKTLLGNDLTNKKQFTIQVTDFLENNIFDMNLAMLYFQMPQPLFNRVLDEIVKLPYASEETKQMIKSILYVENEKVK